MNHRILSILCVAFLFRAAPLILSAASDVSPAPVKGAIQWLYNYEEGQKIARDSGKPIFVVFRCER